MPRGIERETLSVTKFFFQSTYINSTIFRALPTTFHQPITLTEVRPAIPGARKIEKTVATQVN